MRDTLITTGTRTGGRPFPPNPDWFLSTGKIKKFAETTESIAEKTDTAYADVYSVWVKQAS